MTEPQPQKEYIWNRAPSRHGGYVYDIYQTGDHILIAFTKEKAIEIVGVLNNSSAKESSNSKAAPSHARTSDDVLRSDKVLEKIVSDFILKNEIGSPETIYQCDHVIGGACEFIESLCDVVGYFDYDTKEIKQGEKSPRYDDWTEGDRCR